MIIDSFNLSLLRTFECVYRQESMTKASIELGMTQSGVSQSIKNLEDVLNLMLFDRIKQKLVPTESGDELYSVARESLYGLESSLQSLMGSRAELSGTILIGLPMEFGNNVVLPILANFLNSHPRVKLKIRYGHAIDLNQLILKGELDFAIVDSYGLGKEVSSRVVSSEELVLCSSIEYSKKLLRRNFDLDLFQSLDYVSYIEGAPLIRKWLSHHYGIESITINERVSLMNARGVSRMISTGAGVGILPRHMVERFKVLGQKFTVVKSSKHPLVNSLSIAYLETKTMSSTSRECIDFLTTLLKV